jgi:mannose-1-phosphate guanylyltransferase
MRYALIMAGGSGTRLWPMSRGDRPKQLIPFLEGKSLLQSAFERLEGLIERKNRCICAGRRHEQVIFAETPGLEKQNFFGEPIGRDTLNAVGLSAAVLAAKDPEAVISVFTADHLIEPTDEFRRIVAQGFELVERSPETLVTFGITPTFPATGYGYLELGAKIENFDFAWEVLGFKEKPPLELANQYLETNHYLKYDSARYLWNSGMFVWRANTLLDCIRRYEPTVYAGLGEIAKAWDTPRQSEVLEDIFPQLKKISIDFAVMEPASRDDAVRVAAVPMRLRWMDIGSWSSFAETCRRDGHENAIAAQEVILIDSHNCLAASSDPEHLIAMVGCEDLIVIHTPDATLVCRDDQAEQIKELYKQIESRYAGKYL